MEQEPHKTPTKTRTTKQQAGIQIFSRNIATMLNDAGIPYKVLIANIRIDHTEESIKNILREIGRVKFGKDSTAKWTTKECQEIYEDFNRITSEFGVHEPWPSSEIFRED